MTQPRNLGLSRRSFVKAAAAAGVAAPMIIPSGVLGNDKVPAANSRLGVGFIGMGKQVGGHVNGMLGQKGVQVLAVCDVYDPRREFFRKMIDEKHAEYERKDVKPCAAYNDYRELLARPDVDAVFITTPDHWHAQIAMEACKAKKDIYCEKPLTLTIGEAKGLVDTVRKYDRVFQTGSQQRSGGPFWQAVQMIRAGKIGKVKEVHVGIGKTSRPCDLPEQEAPAGLDWDRWLGQAPKRPYNEVLCRKPQDPKDYPFNPGWRDFREYSGGYVTDWGAHHFDIVQWALTQDEAGPDEIRPPESSQTDGYGASFVYKHTPAGDDIVVTHVSQVYEYDAAGKSGKPERKKENNGILFIGEGGKLFVNRGLLLSEPDSIVKSFPAPERRPGHHENWLQCIASRERPICDVEIGARSVTVCHLVNLAYWNNQKLTWDPKQWTFTGANAAEANKWIHRERRKGFELPVV
jgi:predicted dehydrogenase